MIAVLLDQGLPRTAAGLLREIGWDVQHVSERGMSQAEDVAIIEVARQEGRVVVTLDADFHAFTDSISSRSCGLNKPMIILFRQCFKRSELFSVSLDLGLKDPGY